MLTHRVPYPPDRGDRIRSWNILRHLAKSFEISLGCVTEETLHQETKTQLESVCDRVCVTPIGKRAKWLRAGASAMRGRSLTEGLFWSPTLCKTLDRWHAQQPFDGVLVYCSGMLRYARRKSLRQVPRFVDLVDVDSEKFYDYASQASLWKKPLYRTEGYRVRKLEHEACRSAKAVTLVSEAEATVLRSSLTKDEYPIHGITNGVDTDYFAPLPSSTSMAHGSSTEPLHAPRLVFVGVMNYPPNVQGIRWFLEQVWGRFIAEYPQATLEIVGKHPTPKSLGSHEYPVCMSPALSPMCVLICNRPISR